MRRPGVRIPLPPRILHKFGGRSELAFTGHLPAQPPLSIAGCSYGGAKIENEAFVFALARFFIGLSKQRGRVNCCENFWRKLRRQHFAALARNAERWPEDRLCGGRAETNQQRRFH